MLVVQKITGVWLLQILIPSPNALNMNDYVQVVTIYMDLDKDERFAILPAGSNVQLLIGLTGVNFSNMCCFN